VCIVLGAGLLFASRTRLGRAAWNVVVYRVRATWRGWFEGEGSSAGSGAIAGTVRVLDRTPLPGATVLVSTATGVVHQAETDSHGRYQIDDVPPGRYVVVASKWEYENDVYREGAEERTAISVRADRLTAGIDIQLAAREPWQPVLDEPPVLGLPETAYALFPAEVSAQRTPITYTSEGMVITGTMLYQPMVITQPLPVFVAIYPAPPLNWDRASVAFASQGYVLLAVGPNTRRGLDTDGMGRDVLKIVAYLQQGALTPHADIERQGWLAGSFGSLIFYQILLREPGGIDALMLVGGISDAFLGVQALYETELYIPLEYRAAIAALEPPHRYPDFYRDHSLIFDAEHLPPTMAVHTKGDEVIPYNQSLRLAEALTDAGVTHELFLYEDTTHYLDQVNITPDTAELYWRLNAFLDRHVRN
jgi:dipeptidyl aminopeptidase/acylaminoacyl peptidase